MKARYERPVLVRHVSGHMNKFGRLQALRPLTHLEGVPVVELVERYGSPLFVFSEKVMRDRYRELHDALARRWAKVRLAWSYKTNHLGGICRVFHREGAWAEVVSGLEYERAVGLGIPGDRIHFNGPYKPEPVLERALREGAMVHADHFDELALMEQIAERTKMRPKIAIRVNLATDTVPAWNRFGFNLESGQARDAVARIISGDRLELVGLHCHLGTFIQETSAYRQAAEKLARFANELRETFGVQLTFLDLGGGFASHNTLRAQYLPGDQATPSFDRYADALCDGLSALTYPPREQPTLVLETGRALVDDAGYLVTTVVANKRLPDGRRAVVLDAGVNVLFTSFWYKHDVVPAQDFRGMMEPTVFYGPLCMNIDEMHETILFPSLAVGERVVFKNVGAYNVTQWMQFIAPRPAVALIGAERRHALVRRAETLDDVRGPEEMPEWLR